MCCLRSYIGWKGFYEKQNNNKKPLCTERKLAFAELSIHFWIFHNRKPSWGKKLWNVAVLRAMLTLKHIIRTENIFNIHDRKAVPMHITQ